jgi:hypothetical protein
LIDNSSVNEDQNDANDLLRGISSESCLNDGDGTGPSQEIQDKVESTKDEEKENGNGQSQDAKGKKNNKKEKREFMASPM